MSESSRRAYSSQLRQENARATRDRIVAAAGTLMVDRGYADTAMAEVARLAGVAVPTLYTACPGGKPGLAKSVYDAALAGDGEPVPQSDRPAVQAIIDEPDPRRKLARYAAMATAILVRITPVHRVLRAAAAASPTDAGLQQVLDTVDREWLTGTRGPAEHLEQVGALRPGLTAERAADQIFALTSIEAFERLTGFRGWTVAEYESWLADTLSSVLLRQARRRATAG